MRALVLCAAALSLIGAPGCKKNDDDPTFGTTGNVGPVTNRDSGGRPDLGPKIVNEVRFRAFVAWDPVLGQVVPPIIDGSDTYISAYIITLYENGWSSSNETSFCEVVVNLEGLELAPAAKNEGFAWGIDIPSGPKDGYEDCSTKGFDIEEFPEDWKIEDWANYHWALRFYAPLTPDLEDWLTPDSPPTDFDINHYTGGDWWSDDAGRETDADSNYWYGYAMDDLRNVDFDTRLNQQTTMLDGVGDLALGYYVFDQNVYWYNEEPSR